MAKAKKSDKIKTKTVAKQPEIYSKLSEDKKESYSKAVEVPNIKQEQSKMAVDYENLKSETIPNAVVTGGIRAIGLERIDPIQVPQFLLMHPVIPRGIEIKANRLIQLPKEVIPFDDSAEAKEAADMCRKIYEDSGENVFLKKYIQEAYRFGTADVLLLTNETETDILKMELEHPIFFGPDYYGMDENTVKKCKMKIDVKTKRPEQFTQYQKVELGMGSYGEVCPQFKYKVGNKTIYLKPFGTKFPAERVVSLMFDTLGDEPRGIPIVQFLHLTLKHILDIEEAGAQTMVNFGFNKWIAQTPFKTPAKMQAFAATLDQIKKGSVCVLPEGVTLTNIVPGSTEFEKVHNIYLTLISIRLGIPRPLLTMDGTSTNKATLDGQQKDMMLDFFADELIIQSTMNEAFRKICDYKYGKSGQIFDKYPKFEFGKQPEDIRELIEIEMRKSVVMKNHMATVETLMDAGQGKYIPAVVDYAMKVIYPDGVPDDILKEGEEIEPPEPTKKLPKPVEEKDTGEKQDD